MFSFSFNIWDINMLKRERHVRLQTEKLLMSLNLPVCFLHDNVVALVFEQIYDKGTTSNSSHHYYGIIFTNWQISKMLIILVSNRLK